jgi:hypothetical protein
MKSSYLRPAMALALALGLAACGGTEKFTIAGAIGGLAYPGLVLTNNGGSDLPVAANATSFSFPGEIEYGDTYNVQVKTQPAHQTCEVDPNFDSDTAGRMAAINIPVRCGTNVFTLGGKISGLTAEGLKLTNGTAGGSVTVLKDATVFALPNPVPYGESYGVTVLQQPTGQTCTVTNGVGEMGDAAVDNVQVTCGN